MLPPRPYQRKGLSSLAHVTNASFRVLLTAARSVAAVSCCLSALSSCGSDSKNPTTDHEHWAEPRLRPDPTEHPILLDDFATALADAFCSALDDCCAALTLGAGMSDCRDSVRTSYQDQVTQLASLAIDYDPWRAARCIELSTARLTGCSYLGLNAHAAACRQAFRGLKELGEPCQSDIECKTEEARPTYCDRAGSCQPRLGEGAPCALEGCGAGLFCDLEVLSCQPQHESGDCSLQIDACAADSACSPALVCAPKLAQGAACQLSFQCESGACSDVGRCLDSFADADSCSG
jgi:hypothetical protein